MGGVERLEGTVVRLVKEDENRQHLTWMHGAHSLALASSHQQVPMLSWGILLLMRCSSKAVHKPATELPWRGRRPTPDPGLGMPIEVGGGELGNNGNVFAGGQGGAGKGFAAKDAPPAFDQIQPGRADRNKGVLDARMVCQPFPNRTTAVAGKVVGNQMQLALRIRLVKRLQQREVASRIAGERRLREYLAILHAERTIHPHLLRSPGIVQRYLDAMARRRPARSLREVAGSDWT
jgi:hypothetical protein